MPEEEKVEEEGEKKTLLVYVHNILIREVCKVHGEVVGCVYACDCSCKCVSKSVIKRTGSLM